VDELAAKKLQTELEEKISDWSLQRLRWDKRLNHMKFRMIVVGSLILLLQAIHIFAHQLVIPPYNSLLTLGLSIWLVVLVVRYAVGYIDKNCTRSADQLIKLAAEYNAAIKDVPAARHCDFLPPELFQPKRFSFQKHSNDFAAQVASLPLQQSAKILSFSIPSSVSSSISTSR
jgi:hypothetical protein